MKIAILGDTHFGARKNSTYYMKKQKEFFDDRFFPYLNNNGITTVIHLGDVMDNRKSVNFEALRHANECFFEPVLEHKINLHVIIGNHDSFYKSNGDLTSTELLFGDMPNTRVYSCLENVKFDGVNFLMVPWIFPNESDDVVEKIKLSPADVCCGHFEMVNIVYQGSVISQKGIDPSLFDHFDNTFSGHYHKPSELYVGSPYQLTWSDWDDPKRIIIYDTETRNYESVYLADDIYHKIEYNDNPPTDLEQYNDKIVRVVVKSKDDLGLFEKFIEQLEAVEPHSIDIKDEYLYIDVIGEDVEDDKDTLSVLLDSVDDMDEFKDTDKVVIKDIMTKLYKKAQSE